MEAAGHIRAQLPTVIVYMTAYADEPTVQRALAGEPATVMRKPFQISELQRALERALGNT